MIFAISQMNLITFSVFRDSRILTVNCPFFTVKGSGVPLHSLEKRVMVIIQIIIIFGGADS